ncbi:TIGR04211 family SH3 domain-containing protein [Saccharospirillum alexandrii]|uniref:TIGR04211 family SH3 domain-containing protein n=1 Tax=Saccharospirillum alexandrii TaxID=2448477 RepID=UPI0013E0607D|nr:TIGR04211 family SH3 domain-containing protein [Saccharospirillum alexandrii]
MTVLSKTRLILGLTLVLMFSGTASSATLWLIDELWVNVRTGAGDQFRILKTIPSGTRMETLQDEPQNGYYNVRTEEGIEGWIPERFVQEEPTAELQLEALVAERDRLQEQVTELDERYTSLLADRGDVTGELDTLRSENQRLTTELREITQISEDAINLDQRNQQLSEENASLRNELDVARQNLANTRETRESRMLIAGGSLIVIGLIMGVLLPKVRSKRRDSWA